MSVTNYWKNYYLNTNGKLKPIKKTFVPKYLNKRSNSFANFGQKVLEEHTPTASARPRGKFQGWNRSAYFRFRANKDNYSKRHVHVKKTYQKRQLFKLVVVMICALLTVSDLIFC